MNKAISEKWLRIIFFVSLCIFFLNSVNLFDRNIENIMRTLRVPPFLRLNLEIAPHHLEQIIEIVQYLNIAIFLIAVINSFWYPQGVRSLIIFILYGVVTLFTVLILSVYKEHFTFDIFLTGGGWEELSIVEKLTLYVSTISGFITAISGLYGQIVIGRKALAEVEVEKLRLQIEQEKAKSGKKRSTKSRK